MCVHEAGSIKMSAIGEWQCADDWWLTNAKSRLRFCSMMSNIDSVSVGSYANARALQWGLRLKLPAKKTPNNNNKKMLPLSWQEIFLENFEGNCSRKGVNSEHVPKGRRACRTLLQLWWELGAKSFSAATFFGAVLHLCSSCSSPRQQPTSATFHRFIFLTEAAGPCYTTPALLHAPLSTVHTQAKLLWVCKLLLRAKVVANPDKPASAGKWCIPGGTMEPGIPPCSLSQALWLFLWLKPTFPGWHWGWIQIIWVLQVLKNIHRERSNCIDRLSRKKS